MLTTQPKTGMVAHVYNLSIWGLETRETQVQGHPQLHIALEASLDYTDPASIQQQQQPKSIIG